jgi:hypothetical protein
MTTWSTTSTGPGSSSPDRAGDSRGAGRRGRAVSGGGGDLVGVEPFGDRQVPKTLEELGVDAPHDRCGDRVGLQDMQAHAEAGLGGIGVRSGVGDAVAVGWPAAKVAALDGGLGLHGGARGS